MCKLNKWYVLFVLIGQLSCDLKNEGLSKLTTDPISAQKITLIAPDIASTITEGSSLTIVILFESKVPSATSLSWSINGSEGDFLLAANDESVLAESASVTLTVNTIDDNYFELTESYTLVINGPSDVFENELSLEFDIIDNDSQMISPSLAISDPMTSSPSFTRQQGVAITVRNDNTAIRWCLSETQSSRPLSSSSECIGGTGTYNGWLETKPVTYALSNGDGSKSVYLWVVDSSGNINSNLPAPISIQLDTDLPATPVIILSDPISGSSSLSYTASIQVAISGDTDAAAWCIIEQDNVSLPPITPQYNSPCFALSRPTQTVLS